MNLPTGIRSWNNESFLYQSLIDLTATDNNIWDFAKKRDLIIVSKDSDFTYRIKKTTPPPKVIQFKVGNLRRKEFDEFLNLKWNKIEKEIKFNKLVIVHLDNIETIK